LTTENRPVVRVSNNSIRINPPNSRHPPSRLFSQSDGGVDYGPNSEFRDERYDPRKIRGKFSDERGSKTTDSVADSSHHSNTFEPLRGISQLMGPSGTSGSEPSSSERDVSSPSPGSRTRFVYQVDQHHQRQEPLQRDASSASDDDRSRLIIIPRPHSATTSSASPILQRKEAKVALNLVSCVPITDRKHISRSSSNSWSAESPREASASQSISFDDHDPNPSWNVGADPIVGPLSDRSNSHSSRTSDDNSPEESTRSRRSRGGMDRQVANPIIGIIPDPASRTQLNSLANTFSKVL